jgi:hypothetical protein
MLRWLLGLWQGSTSRQGMCVGASCLHRALDNKRMRERGQEGLGPLSPSRACDQ